MIAWASCSQRAARAALQGAVHGRLDLGRRSGGLLAGALHPVGDAVPVLLAGARRGQQGHRGPHGRSGQEGEQQLAAAAAILVVHGFTPWAADAARCGNQTQERRDNNGMEKCDPAC